MAIKATRGNKPDNTTRLRAIQYIDQLAGKITQPEKGKAIGVRGSNIEVIIADY